ncbi:MmgE/PrpD family protein [Microdochium trichocladiopsis]|uniref:MmgE/PrpD family protein n=1 Tax=Microdochium trichocladiopsis TaxID=1682393 RepID=A0A9P9BPE9_9PEZI|nr:MmgE/PrpD family protein [Microdochium trichocladiopsis]KAH7029172.1 MmgE/PrpD family protein [Microdochium trichocladiopsis]
MAGQPQQEPVLAELFSSHALNTKFTDLTPDAVAQAKVFILDTLGVGIAGSSAYGADTIIKSAMSWDGSGPSGSSSGASSASGQATLWGRSARAPSAGIAAMVNGFQVHCQEYDCVHEGAVMHPLATLLPAVMAFADKHDRAISGRELIVACAVGVNVSAGLGIAAKSPMRFFRPATAGGFGAAAAVGRLMGLDEETLVRAFGLQYTQTSGTLQPHVEGSAALPLQVGFNSRAALQACDLAQAGMPGTRDCFEGTYGYLPLIEGPVPWDLSGTMEGINGRRWLIAEISHKPYPAGRATHGGVEGILELMKQGGSTVTPDQIENITITGPPVTARLCSRPDIENPPPNYARLCMSYIGAKVVLNNKPVDLAHYRGQELTDTVTHDLARRIRMVSDGGDDPAALVPISVEMKVQGEAKARSWRCEQMLASPTRRLPREQHLTKFRRCWEFSAEPLPEKNRDRLIALVDDLENLGDIRALTDMMAPPAASARL